MVIEPEWGRKNDDIKNKKIIKFFLDPFNFKITNKNSPACSTTKKIAKVLAERVQQKMADVQSYFEGLRCDSDTQSNQDCSMATQWDKQ